MANDELDTLNSAGGVVFVSYTRRNLDFVKQIVDLLEDEGYDPKIDREDIEVGEKWRTRLSEIIRGCDTVVFILTDEYLASENCAAEVAEAQKRGKRMIPIVPKPLTTPDEKIPAEISSLNYIYFYNLREGDGTGFYDGVKAFKRALRHDLERLRLLRRYEDRAAGWSAGEDDLLSGDQLDQAESWLRSSEQLDGVPKSIQEYIAASRDRQIRNNRIKRWTNYALVGLSVIALTFAGAGLLSWREAGAAKDDLVTLEQEADERSQAFAEVADAWNTGAKLFAPTGLDQSFKVDSSGFDGQDLDQDTQEAVQDALSKLEQASEKLEELDASGADHILSFTEKVHRDLAKVRYFNQSPRSAAPLDLIINRRIMSAMVVGDEVQQNTQLARDFISRAIYSCLDENRRARIERDLSEAEVDINGVVFWWEVEKRMSTAWACEEAREAVCSRIEDCPSNQIAEEITIAESPTAVDRAPVSKDNRFAVKEIYLHISSEDDRFKAEKIKAGLESLEGRQYKVLGIELIKASPGRNRSVRFYYDQQQAEAQRLIEICARLAGENGFETWANPDSYNNNVPISLVGRYSDLPTDRIEIWF